MKCRAFDTVSSENAPFFHHPRILQRLKTDQNVRVRLCSSAFVWVFFYRISDIRVKVQNTISGVSELRYGKKNRPVVADRFLAQSLA